MGIVQMGMLGVRFACSCADDRGVCDVGGDKMETWDKIPSPYLFQVVRNGLVYQPPKMPEESEHSRSRSRSDGRRRAAAEARETELKQQKHVEAGCEEMGSEEAKEFQKLFGAISSKRGSVLRTMVFCLDHCNCARQIAGILTSSTAAGDGGPSSSTNNSTPAGAQGGSSQITSDEQRTSEHWLARLFLLSDVLHNSSSFLVDRAWLFRRELEPLLPDFFHHLGLRRSGSVETSPPFGPASPPNGPTAAPPGEEDVSVHLVDGAKSPRLTSSGGKASPGEDRTSRAVKKVLASWEEGGLFADQFLKGLKACFVLADSDDLIEEYLLTPRMVPKVSEWERTCDHFSQLEKICRARGVRYTSKWLLKDDSNEEKMAFLIRQLGRYEYSVSGGSR